MKPARPTRESNFFWQGFLILLPACLLATMGVVSIRRDWAAAERGLADEAAAIATNLGARVAGTLVDEFGEANSPATLAATARDRLPGAVVLAFGPSGEWLEPKPANSPQKLDLSAPPNLPPAIGERWMEIEMALERGDAAQPLLAQLDNLQQSLDSHPLRPWMRYKQALLLKSLREHQASRTLLETLSLEPDTSRSPAGLPIAVLAALALPTNSSALPAVLIQRLAGHAAAHPGAFADRIFLHLQSVAPTSLPSAEWTAWKLGERARQFAKEWVRAGAPMPNQTAWHAHPAGGRWLILAKSLPAEREGPAGESDTMLVFLPREQILRKLGALLESASLPAHLGLEMELAGEPVSKGQQGEQLATVRLPPDAMPDSHGWSRPAVTTRVLLVDPARYKAGLRKRAWMFGGLVGLASLSVVVGFIGARRAFLNERQLGELRANFVSSVSHELRAPIASMRLMAEELQDQANPPVSAIPNQSKQIEYHRFMVQECRRLSSLIENVLDFARHEQGRQEYEFEATDLGRLVAGTVGAMAPLASGVGVAIRAEIPPGEQVAEVDAPALQRALVNLIDNALKHSPPDSTVVVDLAQSPGERSRISVSDQGQGIPQDELERIFDRFYRRGSELRRETQGIGLGLSIVRLVLEAHGGRAWAESSPGQGSRFVMEFPIHHRSHNE